MVWAALNNVSSLNPCVVRQVESDDLIFVEFHRWRPRLCSPTAYICEQNVWVNMCDGECLHNSILCLYLDELKTKYVCCLAVAYFTRKQWCKRWLLGGSVQGVGTVCGRGLRWVFIIMFQFPTENVFIATSDIYSLWVRKTEEGIIFQLTRCTIFS